MFSVDTFSIVVCPVIVAGGSSAEIGSFESSGVAISKRMLLSVAAASEEISGAGDKDADVAVPSSKSGFCSPTTTVVCSPYSSTFEPILSSLQGYEKPLLTMTL